MYANPLILEAEIVEAEMNEWDTQSTLIQNLWVERNRPSFLLLEFQWDDDTELMRFSNETSAAC